MRICGLSILFARLPAEHLAAHQCAQERRVVARRGLHRAGGVGLRTALGAERTTILIAGMKSNMTSKVLSQPTIVQVSHQGRNRADAPGSGVAGSDNPYPSNRVFFTSK